MSNSQQKQSWSLQDNKRSKDQRDRFKPTGKQPRNYTGYYILSAIFVMLLISVILTLSSKQTLEACLFTGFCFTSKDNVVLYTLYVFATLFIIVFAIISAYLIGKKIGERYKQ
ncbi:hypothetical protein [Formosa sp. S-31]|uniref:hypothetical protein n=1 Tax=Formosa sp. S-31 TaxID=2790949 RepID=UPI003EBAE5D4